MNVSLVRLWTGSHGTFGRLSIEGRAWWSVERPCDDPDHPAIPVGTYPLRLDMHHRGQPDAYPAYWVDDVPGRTAIEIHVANVASQLLGCIAPGGEIGFPIVSSVASLGVLGSGDAFHAFMQAMDGQPGTLTITEDL